MRVSLKRKEHLLQWAEWAQSKRNSYVSISTSLNQDVGYLVHCVFLIDAEVVYLIGFEHGETVATMGNADFFLVVDPAIPPNWGFFGDQKNYNMAYLGMLFDSYTYIGFPEFLEAPNFLELLYDDDPIAVGVLRKQLEVSTESTKTSIT